MAGVIALIPARGGSKGIPQKNLAEFRGLPLVVHSVLHGLEARSVDRVIVSTDDPKIAKIAEEAGADVPFLRPKRLAEDHVLDLPVFEHALDFLESSGAEVPELLVHLRPTTPHREADWIDKAVARLREHPEADSVRSVSPPREHPYRVFRVDGAGYLVPIMASEHPRPYLLRRQELPEMYFYNCVLDVTRTRTIRERGTMTGTRILPFFMNPDDVIDIDSPRDLRVARALWERGR